MAHVALRGLGVAEGLQAVGCPLWWVCLAPPLGQQPPQVPHTQEGL